MSEGRLGCGFWKSSGGGDGDGSQVITVLGDFMEDGDYKGHDANGRRELGE